MVIEEIVKRKMQHRNMFMTIWTEKKSLCSLLKKRQSCRSHASNTSVL